MSAAVLSRFASTLSPTFVWIRPILMKFFGILGYVTYAKNHKDTKTQRKAASKNLFIAAFLCVFVSLWFLHTSPYLRITVLRRGVWISECTISRMIRKGLALTLLLCACACAPQPKSTEVTPMSSFVDDYFNALFEWSPSFGTSVGLHQYDSKIEDLSAASFNRRIERLKQLQRRLADV